MDYKKLSIVLFAILILVAAVFIWKEFAQEKDDREKKPPGDNETTDTGIGDVFAEPPTDFKPPTLPP